MKIELLSIVIPVYNSAETLAELSDLLHNQLNHNRAYEILFVDDGSIDTSWAELEKIKKKYPDAVTAIRLSRNFGQHNAIVCGLGFAKGDYVLTMDDDLQHPPAEISKLISTAESTDADVVYGIPKDRKHGKIRVAGSYFVRKSSRYAAGNTGEGSSFRLMKKEIAAHICDHQHHSMLFIDEILHWYTGNITTVDVEHHNRKKGQSGYSLGKLLTLYMDVVVNHSAIPLKLMTWIGLISSFSSFLLGMVFIYRKLAHKIVVNGFAAQIVAILFSASILMLCMGILGQYMYKLFLLQNRRPPFAINKKI
jgi:polyisoprenyl-phosphate glycosyltransferase